MKEPKVDEFLRPVEEAMAISRNPLVKPKEEHIKALLDMFKIFYDELLWMSEEINPTHMDLQRFAQVGVALGKLHSDYKRRLTNARKNYLSSKTISK